MATSSSPNASKSLTTGASPYPANFKSQSPEQRARIAPSGNRAARAAALTAHAKGMGQARLAPVLKNTFATSAIKNGARSRRSTPAR